MVRGSWCAFLGSQDQIHQTACSHDPLIMDQFQHEETLSGRIKIAAEWDRKAAKGLLLFT